MKPVDVNTGLSAAELQQNLKYDPSLGTFFWRVSGRLAGSVENNGYVRITLSGRRFTAHRLAWLYMTGHWPSDRIDHKNRVRSDNRWENLRSASDRQNSGNSKVRKTNEIGVKGVRLHESGRFQARIFTKGRFKTKLCPSLEEAQLVYATMARETFGEFCS